MPKPKRAIAKSKPHAVVPSELGDRRRLDLLEAAYALTAEKGLAGLRTRDVAARANVNISTLHYYFGTKDALLGALVEYTCGKFNTESREQTHRAETPLQAHLAESWRIFQQTPHLAVVLEELSSLSRREPATRAAFRSVHQRWNAGIQQLLAYLAQGGHMRPDADPTAGAFIISSFVIGATVQLGIDPQAFDYCTVAGELARWAGAASKKPSAK